VNKPISETELIKVARDALVSRLPSTWKLIERRNARTSRTRADLIIEVRGPDGSKGTLLVEAKRDLEPREILRILEQLRANGEGDPFIVSDFLSPRSREMLARRGANYGDATGNLRLTLSKPAVFIETEGAERDPWPEDRPLKSLKGKAAARIVRALCDLEPPFAVRDLASRASVSPASASRVIALLDHEALVERGDKGVVNRVNRADLIRRWVREYSLLKTNRSANFLEPRGLSVVVARLKAGKFKYAVTGSLAASILSANMPARVATIFVSNIPQAAESMDLRRTDTATNVLLIEPFDDVVFERTSEVNGIRCVCLSQLCADLLTGPGRDPVEGEVMLNKFRDNSPTQDLHNPI
jgi:hypothetical protein